MRFAGVAAILGALSVTDVPRVSGFSIPVASRQPLTRSAVGFSSTRLKSEPSDTTSDDYDSFSYEDDSVGVVDTTGKTYKGTPAEEMVSNVMDLMPSQLGAETSPETRAAINEALYKLEAMNPTRAPTVSPLINGVWELRYVGGYAPEWALPSPTRQLALFLYSGGYSPGIFALSLAQKLPSGLVDLGDLEIAISRQQPRVQASITVKVLGGPESEIAVKARLETASDMRLRETYESATVLGRAVEIPKPLQYTRDLYVTYVDEDLLIVRDASGVPEVLLRKEKQFRKWGTEPGELDDMTPPGVPNGMGPSGDELD